MEEGEGALTIANEGRLFWSIFRQLWMLSLLGLLCLT